MRIGSQEWRFSDERPIGDRLVLSTRCGITAPGRSAGVMHRFQSVDFIRYWIRGAEPLYATRAEAAAAYYLGLPESADWTGVTYD